MAEYLIGVDCGNTVCKAAIFSGLGELMGVATRRVETVMSGIGHYEQRPDALWRRVAAVIREVIQLTGIDASAIRALGVSGHGNGLYALDCAGSPLVGIQSLDFRAESVCREWNRSGVAQRAFAYSRQWCWPGQTNALLAWLKHHRNDCYTRIATVFHCKDYVNFRLTGVVGSDISDLSVTNLLDVQARRLSDELLALFDVADLKSAFPPVNGSAEVIGTVTSAAAKETTLKVGTPVVGGMIDLVANMIGSGVTAPGMASIISGSWSVNCALLDKPVTSETLAMVSVFADPRWQLAVEASPTAMTNLEWFVNQFMKREKKKCERRGMSIFAYCDEKLNASGRRENDILFLPFLHGNNLEGALRSGFHNLCGAHTKLDMLNAVYEGIAFSHKSHVDRLRASGIEIGFARLTGGGARGEIFPQLLADVLACRLEVLEVAETGCLGNAMAAGVGIGLFPDLEHAVKVMVKPAKQFAPGRHSEGYYLDKYNTYRQLVEKMTSRMP